jgi:hypothetical protein
MSLKPFLSHFCNASFILFNRFSNQNEQLEEIQIIIFHPGFFRDPCIFFCSSDDKVEVPNSTLPPKTNL